MRGINHSRLHFLCCMFFLSFFVLTACAGIRSVQIDRAKARYAKGQYLTATGDMDRARVLFEKSMHMARAANFREGIGFNLNELAIIETNEGNYARAREYLTEALEIFQDLEMKAEISKAMNNMADTFVKEHRPEPAIEWFQQLAAWDQKSGNALGVGITYYNMAFVYSQQLRDKEKARECLSRAVKVFKETGRENYLEMLRKGIQ